MLTPPKKKTALTSLAGAFGKGGGDAEATADTEPPPSSGTEMTEYGAAFDAFANAAGIAPDKRGAAEAALKQFVSACMREGSSDEE